MEEVDEGGVGGAGVVVVDSIPVILDEREAGDAFEDVGEEVAVNGGAGVVGAVVFDVRFLSPLRDGEADRFVHVWRAEEEVVEELRDRAVEELCWDGGGHSRLEDAGGAVVE